MRSELLAVADPRQQLNRLRRRRRAELVSQQPHRGAGLHRPACTDMWPHPVIPARPASGAVDRFSNTLCRGPAALRDTYVSPTRITEPSSCASRGQVAGRSADETCAVFSRPAVHARKGSPWASTPLPPCTAQPTITRQWTPATPG